MNSNIDTNKKNYKYLLYMAIAIAVATYAAAASDLLLSVVSATVGGGFFAAVCLYKFNLFTVLPMAVLPPCVVYAVTGDPILAFVSASYLPVGATIFYCMRKKLTRSQTVLRTIVSMAVFYAAVYSAYIYVIFGALNFDTIKQYIELNFQIMKDYMKMVEQAYIDSGLEVEKYFPEGLIDAALLSIKLSMLGYIFAFLGICSFIATAISKKASENEKAYPLDLGEWRFVFSKAGGFVFICAYIAGGMYSADTEGLYLPFAINTICVSMYPGILYMGIKKLASKFRSMSGISFIIMAAIVLALFGSYVALLLVIIGLFATFTYKSAPADHK